jgi:hypothetical protein
VKEGFLFAIQAASNLMNKRSPSVHQTGHIRQLHTQKNSAKKELCRLDFNRPFNADDAAFISLSRKHLLSKDGYFQHISLDLVSLLASDQVIS